MRTQYTSETRMPGRIVIECDRCGLRTETVYVFRGTASRISGMFGDARNDAAGASLENLLRGAEITKIPLLRCPGCGSAEKTQRQHLRKNAARNVYKRIGVLLLLTLVVWPISFLAVVALLLALSLGHIDFSPTVKTVTLGLASALTLGFVFACISYIRGNFAFERNPDTDVERLHFLKGTPKDKQRLQAIKDLLTSDQPERVRSGLNRLHGWPRAPWVADEVLPVIMKFSEEEWGFSYLADFLTEQAPVITVYYCTSTEFSFIAEREKYLEWWQNRRAARDNS